MIIRNNKIMNSGIMIYYEYIFPIGLFIRDNIYSDRMYNRRIDKWVADCINHNAPSAIIRYVESLKRGLKNDTK